MLKSVLKLAKKFENQTKVAIWPADKTLQAALERLVQAINQWTKTYHVSLPRMNYFVGKLMDIHSAHIGASAGFDASVREQLSTLIPNLGNLANLDGANENAQKAWLRGVNPEAINVLDQIKYYSAPRSVDVPAPAPASVSVKDLPAAPAAKVAPKTMPGLPAIDKHDQFKLNHLGYTDNEGKTLDIDGKFGPKTHEALNKFKAVTGMLNASDAEALKHLQIVYNMSK